MFTTPLPAGRPPAVGSHESYHAENSAAPPRSGQTAHPIWSPPTAMVAVEHFFILFGHTTAAGDATQDWIIVALPLCTAANVNQSNVVCVECAPSSAVTPPDRSCATDTLSRPAFFSQDSCDRNMPSLAAADPKCRSTGPLTGGGRDDFVASALGDDGLGADGRAYVPLKPESRHSAQDVQRTIRPIAYAVFAITALLVIVATTSRRGHAFVTRLDCFEPLEQTARGGTAAFFFVSLGTAVAVVLAAPLWGGDYVVESGVQSLQATIADNNDAPGPRMVVDVVILTNTVPCSRTTLLRDCNNVTNPIAMDKGLRLCLAGIDAEVDLNVSGSSNGCHYRLTLNRVRFHSVVAPRVSLTTTSPYAMAEAVLIRVVADSPWPGQPSGFYYPFRAAWPRALRGSVPIAVGMQATVASYESKLDGDTALGMFLELRSVPNDATVREALTMTVTDPADYSRPGGVAVDLLITVSSVAFGIVVKPAMPLAIALLLVLNIVFMSRDLCDWFVSSFPTVVAMFLTAVARCRPGPASRSDDGGGGADGEANAGNFLYVEADGGWYAEGRDATALNFPVIEAPAPPAEEGGGKPPCRKGDRIRARRGGVGRRGSRTPA